MSNKDDTYKFPPNEQIIDDVVQSCKNLNLEKDSQETNREMDVDDCSDDNDDQISKNDLDDEDFIDDTLLKDIELSLTPEELEKNKITAIELKSSGNGLYKEKNYNEAQKKYTEALKICPLSCIEERAILFSNRAACKIAREMKTEAISDCDSAIKLNPTYVRALCRRAKLYEDVEKLDEALADYQKILELDSGNSEARAACIRLPVEINERNEKLKEQMLSSLKELGNKILKPFGLSTNNFQVQKDPNSGGYSINFNQNPK